MVPKLAESHPSIVKIEYRKRCCLSNKDNIIKKDGAVIMYTMPHLYPWMAIHLQGPTILHTVCQEEAESACRAVTLCLPRSTIKIGWIWGNNTDSAAMREKENRSFWAVRGEGRTAIGTRERRGVEESTYLWKDRKRRSKLIK